MVHDGLQLQVRKYVAYPLVCNIYDGNLQFVVHTLHRAKSTWRYHHRCNNDDVIIIMLLVEHI